MSESLVALEELLALSEAMVSAAAAEDWENLASREAERRALADRLPADLTASLAATAQPRARLLIAACQRCEASIRPLVEARLDDLRVVLRAVRGPALPLQ
ncbi:conserved hypothetical protein [Candidatus Accumulibacter aalborgensis]|uniref:Flagellar protein FliT n=1 Tax=Candidatus Accumulibacter aalborgensis TaxID=1860102 RepID=A0A1A8XGA7_9PROT|nr:flagellar protein FliT [Candidatus Accumulibacter aalborgensis]SBT04214.1 conserved hypothetical protein [Candidatus Accumulibacter aalborgensis]